MRKIILTITILIFSNQLDAQKTFKTRAGKYKWVYNHRTWDYFDGDYIDSVYTDSTFLNNKYYHQIGKFYIRDSGNKVYCYSNNKEFLIMDYSVNVGDTFRTNNGRNIEFKVISKSKIKIETDSLIIITLKPSTFPLNWPPMTWIESIGCISQGYHPINWTELYGFTDIGYEQQCFIVNDTNLLSEFGLTCFKNDLLNPNKKWHVWESNDNGDRKYGVTYYNTNKDTLINGKKYFIMNDRYSFARYDSISKKYYALGFKSMNEILIFDENAKIGDTINLHRSWLPAIVRSIDYGFYDNIYRKTFKTDYDTYVTGIGSLSKVFWENDFVYIPEFQNGNICYEENNSLNYKFPFYYQNNNSCEITSGISDNELEKIQILIQNNKLYLSHISLTNSPYSIRIFNLQGQEIFQSKLSKNAEQVFDLEFKHGIYILQIISNQSVISKKIEF